MSNNRYGVILTPQPDADRDNVYLIQRPTFVSFADMNFTFEFRPSQTIRFREVITFAAQRTYPQLSHQWNNRPFVEAFMGHYVIVKQLESGESWGTISQKIIGKREQGNEDIFSFSYAHEFELRAYAPIGDRGTVQSIIRACNAEIRPAVVQNTEITVQNALQYAKILFLLGKKQLAQAGSAILELSKPVIAGFRFGDGVNFIASTQVDLRGFTGGQLATSIGDLWISLEPDWSILSNAQYDIRAIDFAILDPEPAQFQFPDVIVCQLPEQEPTLPPDNGCYTAFQQFLLTTSGVYPSLSAAQTARFSSGINPTSIIIEKEWTCPGEPTDVYSYWKLQEPLAPGCTELIDQYAASGAYKTLAEAQAAYPGFQYFPYPQTVNIYVGIVQSPVSLPNGTFCSYMYFVIQS